MGRRSGTCARCGRHRRLTDGACRKCRSAGHRSDRAEVAADIGETAVETGALGALGRVFRAVFRALFD